MYVRLVFVGAVRKVVVCSGDLSGSVLVQAGHTLCCGRSAGTGGVQGVLSFRHGVAVTSLQKHFSVNSHSANSTSVEEAGQENLGARAFSFLLFSHLAVGSVMIFAPQKLVEVVFAASPSTLVSGLVMVLGAVHLYAAVFCYALASAAEHRRLGSDTYRRLGAGLVAWSLMELVKITLLTQVSMSSMATYGYSALFFLTCVIGIKFSESLLLDFKKFSLLPIISLQNVYGLSAIAAVFATSTVWYQRFLPESFLGKQLGALNWINAPAGTLGLDIIQHISLAGMLFYSAYTVLLDASQRGRLGASTFKQLNLGTAAVAGLYCAFLVKISEFLFIPNVFSAYPSHLMDIFSMKLSIWFILVGVICFVQWKIAAK